MSGGSFNYLYAKDPYEFIRIPSELEDMRDTLAGLGYAHDAARETDELLIKLRHIQVIAETRLARLGEVWKAVEWWKSCDTDEASVKAALAKYRGDSYTPRSSQSSATP